MATHEADMCTGYPAIESQAFNQTDIDARSFKTSAGNCHEMRDLINGRVAALQSISRRALCEFQRIRLVATHALVGGWSAVRVTPLVSVQPRSTAGGFSPPHGPAWVTPRQAECPSRSWIRPSPPR